MFLELHFPLLGESLPIDHGYPLYAALCRILPELHAPNVPWAIGPVPGDYAGPGRLALRSGRARLRIRLPDAQIAAVLPLAGQALDVAGHRVRLGVPNVRGIVPAVAVVARLVTIKGFTAPDQFLDAVRRKLAAAGVQAEATLPTFSSGPRAGEPQRRILRIQGRSVVGFAVALSGLSAEDSLTIQTGEPPPGATALAPLFSRRKFGCAYFTPVRESPT